ncbi:efflux RND transporter periplasmic adaptor subunit [Sporocytophaga myxococcoides]|uniref:efflux RND transporter periplasmic adaptor subunit n=1 Tax=Sporocytophaga myxococcoides TaxID=153721 RepID=UPI00041D5B9A|nr:efflux RND transporter periplasmic adaptor subunit [Sporocytophaga myxococcoides]
MKKKIIVISSVLVIVLFIGFKLASNKKKLDEKNKPAVNTNVAIPVSTALVAVAPVSGEMTKVGTAAAFQEADVMALSSGKISNLNIELGSYVKKGQVIAILDTRTLQLNLEASELDLNKVKKDYDKYNELLQGNAATETQVTDLQFKYQTSANKVEQIKKQIADAHITAPVSGKITKKNFEEGEYASPGAAIASIVDITRLKVKVMVSEKEVYTLKENQTVKVTADVFPDQVFNGKISYISPAGDEAHNYPVEVIINNSSSNSLKAGTYVKVEFGTKSSGTALQITRDALIESIKNPSVYVVEGDIVKKRNIKVGREFGSTVEVLDGLKEGETVVTNGQINLNDQSKIQIVK